MHTVGCSIFTFAAIVGGYLVVQTMGNTIRFPDNKNSVLPKPAQMRTPVKSLATHGLTCQKWGLEEQAGEYMPHCQKWAHAGEETDSSHDLWITGTHIKHGYCSAWSVLTELQYVSANCDDIRSHIDGVHDSPEKRESGVNNRPPTLTYVDVETIEAQGKKCKHWVVGTPNEHNVLKPECEEWMDDPKQTKDYAVDIVQLQKGECTEWQVFVHGEHARPECMAGHW